MYQRPNLHHSALLSSEHVCSYSWAERGNCNINTYYQYTQLGLCNACCVVVSLLPQSQPTSTNNELLVIAKGRVLYLNFPSSSSREPYTSYPAADTPAYVPVALSLSFLGAGSIPCPEQTVSPHGRVGGRGSAIKLVSSISKIFFSGAFSHFMSCCPVTTHGLKFGDESKHENNNNNNTEQQQQQVDIDRLSTPSTEELSMVDSFFSTKIGSVSCEPKL